MKKNNKSSQMSAHLTFFFIKWFSGARAIFEHKVVLYGT